MDWKRGDDWHLKSGCGNYTISKSDVKGTPVYNLWRKRMHISMHDSADTAKKAAEAHEERWVEA